MRRRCGRMQGGRRSPRLLGWGGVAGDVRQVTEILLRELTPWCYV
jgi:hypothetical protein